MVGQSYELLLFGQKSVAAMAVPADTVLTPMANSAVRVSMASGGSGLLKFEKQHYLLVADNLSYSPEVMTLQTTTSTALSKPLSPSSPDIGVSKVAWSNNGPQHSSLEFDEFENHTSFVMCLVLPIFPRVMAQQSKC